MARSIGAAQLAELLTDWRSAPGAGYRTLADRVRLLAIDGRLPAGSRLPGERDLAERLGASRNTIGAALEELRAAGYVETLRGSGSVIRIPGGSIDSPGSSEGMLDFATASSPAVPGFQAAAERALPRLPAALGGPGYEFLGIAALREALAARYTARGLHTSPSQILVTSGAQPAIALVARTLLSRGDRAVVESPGYPHAYEALRVVGARLLPIAVHSDTGWDLGEAERLLRRAAPALAYVMPDFHNPTGRSLSEPERARLVRIAEDAGTILVVDETTGELDIDRGSLPLPASFASRRSSVVTIGSASKTMWGGLRVGWIRAGEDLIAAFAAARPVADLGTAVFDQLVVTELLAEFDLVLEHRRREHRAARDALAARLAARLPEWHVPPISGGLSAWVRFDAPVSSQLAIGARARGLRIAAGPWFGLDGAFERFLRIPFSSGPEASVRAVDILADVWRDVADAPLSMDPPLAAVV
ncbi:MAG: PLP-dependent aminotransferase family protein [Naasia sp.]|uniref:MocR-like transcription factor YczR n=1 Tax=Naasia sp. TaxID=2546198 RepID=UPI00260D4898|nr:PLP-dependent aminotransferase family protein [Naasia sp.]MCU1570627.1 PLP-dependent aminotransferase family protein [Naasia sp.]